MRCSRCDAEISSWEVLDTEHLSVTPCWCGGVPSEVSRTLANVAYSALCDPDLSQPVKVHDVVRLVTPNYNGNGNPGNSINVALSRDKRFCWGGRGLYGLARHGLIPGVRSLAEAAYAVLLCAPSQLYVEEVDFVLDQLNYRFNPDSLFHHLRGHTKNRWQLKFKMDPCNQVSVNTGRGARHEYNSFVGVCPTHRGFDIMIENTLGPRVERLLADRANRLAQLEDRDVHVAGDRVEFR